MEDRIIMDQKAKRKYGILAFIPFFAWGITLLYYLYVLFPVMQQKAMEDGVLVATVTAHHYTVMFAFIAASAILSAITLTVFIVHIAKIKTINSPTKMMWILILCVFVPISFVLFWYIHVRHEPKNEPVYTNMA